MDSAPDAHSSEGSDKTFGAGFKSRPLSLLRTSKDARENPPTHRFHIVGVIGIDRQ